LEVVGREETTTMRAATAAACLLAMTLAFAAALPAAAEAEHASALSSSAGSSGARRQLLATASTTKSTAAMKEHCTTAEYKKVDAKVTDLLKQVQRTFTLLQKWDGVCKACTELESALAHIGTSLKGFHLFFSECGPKAAPYGRSVTAQYDKVKRNYQKTCATSQAEKKCHKNFG